MDVCYAVILCMPKKFLLLFMFSIMQSKLTRDTNFLPSVFTYHIMSLHPQIIHLQKIYRNTFSQFVLFSEVYYDIPFYLYFFHGPFLHPTALKNLVNFTLDLHYYAFLLFVYSIDDTCVSVKFSSILQKKNTHTLYFWEKNISRPHATNFEMDSMRNSYHQENVVFWTISTYITLMYFAKAAQNINTFSALKAKIKVLCRSRTMRKEKRRKKNES